MNNDDIVARLRAVLHNDRSVELMNREAADEIERLRKERNEAEPLLQELWDRRTEVTEMSAKIEQLRSERDEARHGEAVATATLYGMIEERTALRAERDEARREVCVLMQRTGFLRGDYAAERNWDCFDRTVNGIDANEIRVDLAGGNQ